MTDRLAALERALANLIRDVLTFQTLGQPLPRQYITEAEKALSFAAPAPTKRTAPTTRIDPDIDIAVDGDHACPRCSGQPTVAVWRGGSGVAPPPVGPPPPAPKMHVQPASSDVVVPREIADEAMRALFYLAEECRRWAYNFGVADPAHRENLDASRRKKTCAEVLAAALQQGVGSGGRA